jgi:hypothetical protein
VFPDKSKNVAIGEIAVTIVRLFAHVRRPDMRARNKSVRKDVSLVAILPPPAAIAAFCLLNTIPPLAFQFL